MRLGILSFILVLSGCSALIFQTLWLRLCGLAFGNSVWAAALTLSSFMAGLALGGAIAARRRSLRIPSLRAYAILELIVAVSGVTVVYAVPAAGELLRPWWETLWERQSMLIALRLALSFVLLLLPATAIGLTLPVLLDDPALQRHRFDRTLSVLYGFNTIGAVVGALLCEFWLLEKFGLLGSGVAAGTVSAIAALLAWFWGAPERVAPERPRSSAPSRSWVKAWRWLIASALSGAILLCLEVVWMRFLRLYVPSSPAAFAVMLATVLAGIGLGSLAVAVFARHARSTPAFLPVTLLLAALATLVSYLLFPAPASSAALAQSDNNWQEVGKLAFVLTFPVAFLSGTMFPAIAAGVHQAFGSRMNAAGLTALWNTVGAAMGPLLASFLLLPWLGFQQALILCAIAYSLLALLLADPATWQFRSRTAWAIGTLAAAFVALMMLFPYKRDEWHFAHARKSYEADGSRLIAKVEGTEDTLQVLRQDFLGEPYSYRLVTNSFSMSGTHPRSQRYMRLFAYLPVTLRPDTQDALLLCYGVGVTADALVRVPDLKRLDVVDISAEVLSLADTYADGHSTNSLMDDRVNTFVQDARFFLRAAPNRYDLITGEPPPLKVAGTVNLYTREFFALMRDRLNEGGIVTYWLPIYQVSVEETKSILKAFHDVFPNATVWASSDLEWIMMGSKGDVAPLDPHQMGRLWRHEATREDLFRVGLERPEQLAALFVMGPSQIAELTRTTLPLTDAFPKRLGDASPSLEATHRFAWSFMQANAALGSFYAAGADAIWPSIDKALLEQLFLVRETRYLSALTGSNWLAELDLYLHGTQLRTPVLEVLHSDPVKTAIAERLAAHVKERDSVLEGELVASAIGKRDFETAIALLEKRLTTSPKENDVYLLTYLYCLRGRQGEAEALARRLPTDVRDDSFTQWLWQHLQASCGFQPPKG